MEENEKSSLRERYARWRAAGRNGRRSARLKTAASHAVEDTVTEAKRLAKRAVMPLKT